ncbi:MAG TPA: hypothetical protein VLZ83_05565 [Edaphocola sp.]|nr:hypothetical protein [Edaphocola sp.]
MKVYVHFLIVSLLFLCACNTQSREVTPIKEEHQSKFETNGNISMEINGERWSATSNLSFNIFFADENKQLLDIHIGGQDDKMQGLGINLRVYRNSLEQIKGKYPIYANNDDVEAYTAIINGGVGDVHFDTQMLPNKKGSPIGFVQIKEAQIAYNRNGPYFTHLKASFEAAFKTEDQEGQLMSINIKNGILELKSPDKNDPTYKTGFQINLNGKEWDADQQEFSATTTDDQKQKAIVISGERSGMDMDAKNQGWVIRFYLDIPKNKIKDFNGAYSLGPNSKSGNVYFEQGDQISLDDQAQLIIEDMEVLEIGDENIIIFLKGKFTIYPKDGRKEIKGKFHIRDYDTGRI